MNYCHKCRVLFEDDRCPHCDNPYVWPPEADDYCFLTEKEFPWSRVLEQALKEEGIPVVADDSVVGAWMTSRLGVRFERTRLFVPYAHLEQAKAMEQEMFDENGQMPEGEWPEDET